MLNERYKQFFVVFITLAFFAGCAENDTLEYANTRLDTVSDKQIQSSPNIVLILADDMGYGDIQAYNPQSKIPTPNLDALARDGLRFTDAHSPSAVCTPSRYSLLTGRYAWRTSLKRGVLGGRSPLLIDVNRDTIASVLQDGGYHTAAIGKWLLALAILKKESLITLVA